MSTIEFLPFATAGGANVVPQAEYAAAGYVQQGRGSGILPSAVYNKIARQGNFVAAGVATFISQALGVDVLDDGDLAGFVTKLAAAVASSSSQNFTTGDGKLTFKTAADTGWVMMNDGTIGDASSGGTTRASPDCQALFVLLWNNVSNTYAPVSSGRGASALADWSAHKTIALTKQLGRAIIIAGSGAGLTARSLGAYLGEETTALVAANNGPHAHGVNDPGHAHGVSDPGHAHGVSDPGHAHSFGTTGGPTGGFASGSGNGAVVNTGVTASAGTGIGIYAAVTGIGIVGNGTGISIQSQGSGTPHNTMQPSSAWNIECKL